MTRERASRVLRLCAIAGGNVLLFLLLFGIVELSYRMYVDGVGPALRGLFAPASRALPENHWVVRDEELGYRLDPANPEFNSFSFRGGEVAVPKPDGVYRVLYLGDSVPFDFPGFVSITRDSLTRLGPIEVLNASVPGYTSYQEVLFYERYLRRLEPDLVVWTYVLNDNHRVLHRFAADGRMLLTREAEASMELAEPWSILVAHSYVLRRIHLGLLTVRSGGETSRESRYEWEHRADVGIAWEDDSWRMYEAQLRRLLELTRPSGTRVVVVSFPLRSQVEHARRLTDDPEELTYVLEPQVRLDSVLALQGVPHLDLTPAFREASGTRRALYRDAIHLSPEGHAVAAREILAFLREHGLPQRGTD